MNKLVLVPLARFEVKYDLASGESYGEVHRRILRAIGRRGASLEQLQEQFCLPARFLIESLVNLFTEGWLTITLDGFRLTTSGLKGLEENRTPSFFQCSTGERTNVMMEQVTGGLIRENAITYRTRGALQQSGDWDDALRMKAEYSTPIIDRAQVKPFIFHRKEQWIRNVSDAKESSGEWHWLPVDVNVETGAIAGLPSSWEPTLKQAILELVEQRPDLGLGRSESYWKGRAPRIKPQGPPTFVVRFKKEDLLFSAVDHGDAILRVLDQHRGRILVLSSAGGGLALDLRRGFAKFREKGGKLDLFRAKTSEGNSDAEISELPGCGSNLILHRDEEGGSAILGSFPWLGTTDSSRLDASIVVHHAEIVASLCESAASLLEGSDALGLHSEAIDFWRNAAGALYDQFAQEPPSEEDVTDAEVSEIRLIRDLLHNQEAADLVLMAQSRCVIASAVAESKRAMRTLSALARRVHSSAVETRIMAGMVNIGVQEIKEIDAILAPFGTRLRADPKHGINVVLSDTSVLISSHQFLGGAPPRTTEIGLLVDRGSVAKWVWDRLAIEEGPIV
jgi:hypothetical protein